MDFKLPCGYLIRYDLLKYDYINGSIACSVCKNFKDIWEIVCVSGKNALLFKSLISKNLFLISVIETISMNTWSNVIKDTKPKNNKNK
ncbi:MAG: hypothetical protein ACK5WP_05700 [Neisseriaceae bacterium]